jgi:methyl-accepting chemotaxis protein
MDQTNQQNARLVQQSTAAIHPLARATDARNRAMGRFRVDAEAHRAA